MQNQPTETENVDQELDTVEFGGIGVNRGRDRDRDRDRDGNSSLGDTVQSPDSIFDF